MFLAVNKILDLDLLLLNTSTPPVSTSTDILPCESRPCTAPCAALVLGAVFGPALARW